MEEWRNEGGRGGHGPRYGVRQGAVRSIWRLLDTSWQVVYTPRQHLVHFGGIAHPLGRRWAAPFPASAIEDGNRVLW